MGSSMVLQFLFPKWLATDTTANLCRVTRRNHSIYRRTRRALNVKPDPSFLPSKTEPEDHIVFNPPSSAPSVYHTPVKFLPQNDPRRSLHSRATNSTPSPKSASATSSEASEPLSALATIAAARRNPSSRMLKPVRPVQEKKYHIAPEEIEEIRRLRAEDPRKWTRLKLAEKFSCSQFFIGLCCSSPEMAQEHKDKLAAVKKKWGRRKTEAREARTVRKKLWGRDA